MANPVVVLNKMSGFYSDVDVVNAQSNVDVVNGAAIGLSGILSGQPDVYVASTPTSVTTSEVLLVHSPEIIEINGLRVNLTDPTLFTNPAGRPFTAYRLRVGNTFTITADGLSGSPAVDKYVIPQNNSNALLVANDLTGGTRVAMVIKRATTVSVGQTRKTAYQLEVVKGV